MVQNRQFLSILLLSLLLIFISIINTFLLNKLLCGQIQFSWIISFNYYHYPKILKISFTYEETWIEKSKFKTQTQFFLTATQYPVQKYWASYDMWVFS
jgi:hypothetical protein